jgi:hypothetical protein
MYTYYSKGMADYVGIWDYDEFFQPRGENKNILDVINAMESPLGPVRKTVPSKLSAVDVSKSGQRARRGMADSDGHPFCYLILESEVTKVDKVCKSPDVVRTRLQSVQPLKHTDVHIKSTISLFTIQEYILMYTHIATP